MTGWKRLSYKLGHDFILWSCVTCCIWFACQSGSKDNTRGDYLDRVIAYADALIEKGRDEYGTVHSPLFASTLNRKTLRLANEIEIGKIDGVRENDRSRFGANLIHDEYLFKILYELWMQTGNDQYRDEADKAITYFFRNCQSPVTGLLCWGEHLYWNFLQDGCGHAPDYDYHEATHWPFWDQAYRLAPDAAWNFVLNEWEHQIHDKATGDFSRHARYSSHETFSGFDFPRYAGQMIERWADAYRRSENAGREGRENLLRFIEVLFNRMQENAKLSESGYLVAGRSPRGDHINVVWLTNNLELARCLEVAADVVGSDLAGKMRRFALKQDEDFFKAPHTLEAADGGFAVTLHASTGLPRQRSMNKPYSSMWSAGYGYGTHAGVANIIHGRHQSLKGDHLEMANGYQRMILQVGEKYLSASPDTTILLKPSEFAEIIELMLNCHDLSGKVEFVQRAEYFAKLGMHLFLPIESPLPKASNHHDHYESITGGPAFMYQLLRLHQILQH